MKFTVTFPDSFECYVSNNAKHLWYTAYSHLRYTARYYTPNQFTHMDLPELGVTVARHTIPEHMTNDGKLHRSTSIERTVF